MNKGKEVKLVEVFSGRLPDLLTLSLHVCLTYLSSILPSSKKEGTVSTSQCGSAMLGTGWHCLIALCGTGPCLAPGGLAWWPRVAQGHALRRLARLGGPA